VRAVSLDVDVVRISLLSTFSDFFGGFSDGSEIGGDQRTFREHNNRNRNRRKECHHQTENNEIRYRQETKVSKSNRVTGIVNRSQCALNTAIWRRSGKSPISRPG
jgi:hypothetical protein